MKKTSTKTFKQLAVELLANTTMHGLPNIMRARHSVQTIFWVICTLASAIACCFLVIQSVTDYFSYDVITKIRNHHEDSLLFPRVTICNRNMFTTDYAVDFLDRVARKHNLATHWPSKMHFINSLN